MYLNSLSCLLFYTMLSKHFVFFIYPVSTLERRVKLLNTAQDNSRLRQEMCVQYHIMFFVLNISFSLRRISLATDTTQLAKMADSAIKKVKQNSRSLQPVSYHHMLHKTIDLSNCSTTFQT